MADGTHASALHEAKRDMELRRARMFDSFWERLVKLAWPPEPGTQPEGKLQDPVQEAPERGPASTASSHPGPHRLLRKSTPLAETRRLTKGNHSQTKAKHIGGIPVQQQCRNQPHRPAVTQLKRGMGNFTHTNKRWTTRPTKETTTVQRHGYGYSLRTHSQVRPNARATVYSPTQMPAHVKTHYPQTAGPRGLRLTSLQHRLAQGALTQPLKGIG
ncbi:Hypothetical predicted protein [Pelobates cultripes]|uniref:Uncharacterized protein n=1 Tax=Pelobates cultripes TaxID=61616 RepID=A0AAD1RUV0_PELCU|nr:Hypothetical predicted protein [Pelobates cultripes]